MSDNGSRDRGALERRRNSRRRIRKNVEVEVDGETVAGEISDISLSGVSINALVDMSTEQFVRLHLEKFGVLPGEVVRHTEAGFAMEFDRIEDNGSVLEEKLRAMLEKDAPHGKQADDPVAAERKRMEAQLMSMLGGNGDDDE